MQLSYSANDLDGFAVDEPVHDWASHACDRTRVIAEAEMADMLSKRRFDSEHSSTASDGSDRISR